MDTALIVALLAAVVISYLMLVVVRLRAQLRLAEFTIDAQTEALRQRIAVIKGERL